MSIYVSWLMLLHHYPTDKHRCIHARHARAPLSIAQDMFMFIFTYHQIVPCFLDFVLPFGAQINARDTYFSGLRNESRIASGNCGVQIPQLLRSGKELRMCYNLRSAEPSASDPALPWSIRQCAVYHSFDVQTGKALWVTVKGNDLIKERIQDDEILRQLSRAETRSGKLSSALKMHLMLCDWASENWRGYVSELEEKVRKFAPGALAIPVDKPRTPPPQRINLLISPTQRIGSFPSTIQTPISPVSPKPRSGTFSSMFPSRSPTLVAAPAPKMPKERGHYGQIPKNCTAPLDETYEKKRYSSEHEGRALRSSPTVVILSRRKVQYSVWRKITSATTTA